MAGIKPAMTTLDSARCFHRHGRACPGHPRLAYFSRHEDSVGSETMNSVFRWVAMGAADIIIRFGYTMLKFIPFSFAPQSIPFFFPISLRWSLIHLGLLIPIASIVSVLDRHRGRALTISLILVNVLFVSTFALLELSRAKASQITSCHGALDNCSWKDGNITSLGITEMTNDISGHLVINVLVLSFWFASSREHPSAR